jgi:hypothetical protein
MASEMIRKMARCAAVLGLISVLWGAATAFAQDGT